MKTITQMVTGEIEQRVIRGQNMAIYCKNIIEKPSDVIEKKDKEALEKAILECLYELGIARDWATSISKEPRL